MKSLPQVRKHGFTNKVDLWSVGVAAHVLLTGDMIGRSSDFRPEVGLNYTKCN